MSQTETTLLTPLILMRKLRLRGRTRRVECPVQAGGVTVISQGRGNFLETGHVGLSLAGWVGFGDVKGRAALFPSMDS